MPCIPKYTFVSEILCEHGTSGLLRLLLSALTFTWSPVFRVTLKFATVEVHRLFTLAGMKAEADERVSMTKAANDLTIVLSWAYAGVGSVNFRP